MTITTTSSVVSYVGDGTANPLPVSYPFFDPDELEVISTVIATGVETTLALGSDYTVAGGDDDVGTVTPAVSRPATVKWTIRRATERLQQTDYPPNDDFPAEAHEEALDRLTAIAQELDEAIGRSIQFPKSESGVDNILPAKAARANLSLNFDSNGDLAVGATPTAQVSAAMMPVVNAGTIPAALGLLGVNPNAGFRNRLLNGGFSVWQRGAGGSASIAIAASTSAYTADQFKLITGTNQASVVSQQAGLNSNSQWSARIQRNSGQTGTGVMYLEQPLTLEQIVPLRGQSLALQFMTSSGADFSPTSGNLGVAIYCGTGSAGARGGAPYTNETQIAGTVLSLGKSAAAALQQLLSSVVVPVNTTQMTIQFSWSPVGTALTNDWFGLDDVQLEIGGACTVFEQRPFDLELMLCKVFYQKSFVYSIAPAQNAGLSTGESFGTAWAAGATANQRIFAQLLPAMRAAPNMTLFNPAAANAQIRDESAPADCSGSSSNSVSANSFVLFGTGNASTAIGNRLGCHWTAEAGL